MTRRDEDGFTFIELLVAVTILGIIMSAITSGLIAVIRTTGGTSERVAQSHDSQLLARWLVPDLQSAANPNGVVLVAPSPAPDPAMCASGTPFAELRLSWTDAATGTPYRYDYVVDTATWVLRRNFVTGPAAEASFVVVHNLEDPAQPVPAGATARYPACFEKTAAGRVTVTITTLVENGTAQFSFKVATQTRQPYVPPAPLPPAPPESVDANEDGKVDAIVVQFDQPVACLANPCDPSKWSVIDEPGYRATDGPAFVASTQTPTAVSISSSDNKTVTLNLPAAAIDTRAAGMKVALDTGTLVGAGNTAVTFPATDVRDGMAPVMVSAASRDTDSSGTLDQVLVTFSESVSDALSPSAYKLLNAPGAIDVDPATVTQSGASGMDYILAFPGTVTTVDTIAAGAKVRVTPGTATDGNKTNPAADVPVLDRMAPVLDPLVAPVVRDTDTNGKADRVIVAFTENLAPYTAPTSVWSLANAPSAATVFSVAVSGKLATLTLAEGAAFDTATGGFTVALSANATGARDASGNTSGFGPATVADRMSPILLSPLTTTVGTLPGSVQANDTMTLTFSEAVTLASAPITMTIGKVSGNNVFTLNDLVTINVNTGTYANSAVSCQVLVTPSGASVTVTVQGCNGTTGGSAAKGTATPAATLRDAAPAPNLAAGSLELPDTTVLF